MFTAVTFTLVIVGLLLLALFPWTGAGILTVAYWVHRQATDEESFVTGLCILASLGVAAEVVRWVIEH